MKFNKLRELLFNPKLKQRARDLRNAGNIHEVKFWLQVKKKNPDIFSQDSLKY